MAAKTEFYADLVVNQIDKFFKTLYGIIWWIWLMGFLVGFVSIWFLPQNSLKTIEETVLGLLAQIPIPIEIAAVLALMPFWFSIVGEMLSWAVKMVRKYVLYPKTNFTETTTGLVLKKERIVHRRSKARGSFSYYFIVKHPISNDLIRVEVDTADTFEKIKESDMVRLKHLPTATNILYMCID